MQVKPRDQQVFEILTELGKIKSEKNKIEWLKDNFSDHTPLQYILKFNYCASVVSVLPEGQPPFDQTESDGPAKASLWQYLNVFPVFVRSPQSQKMKMVQIERVFIEMLEAIEKEEAELVCLAKDRKLEERFDITRSVVDEAFPNLVVSSAEMPVIKPITPEERADNLLTTAKELKARAKELQLEAREYEKEAKELLKVVKDAKSESAA